MKLRVLLEKIEPIKAVITGLVFIYGNWIMGSVRTTDLASIDIHGKTFIAGLIFVYPFSFLAFYYKSFFESITKGFVYFIIIFLSVITIAGLEEYIVMSEYTKDDLQLEDTLILERWYPFQNHVIVYSKDNGWDGND